MNLQEKTLDAMDRIVLPASTADIYSRMVKLGYYAGINAGRERADVSSVLNRLRKSDKVFSAHDNDGVLLWDVVEIKGASRQAPIAVQEIRDEINRVRSELPQTIILAELFNELGNSLLHASNILRKMK